MTPTPDPTPSAEAKLREVEARARALREVVKAATSLEQHELADVPRNLLTPPQRHLTDALARWREGETQNAEVSDDAKRRSLD